MIDCDLIARAVALPGNWGWKRVVAALGTSVVKPNGELDREKIAAIVFKDSQARKRLNAATHLPILVQLMGKILHHWVTLQWVVVVDMPLLIETGFHKFVNPVVVISCNEEVQLQRLMTRDGSNREAALARVHAQMSLAEKRRHADIAIDNNAGLAHLQEQVQALAVQLKSGASLWGWALSPVAVLVGLAGCTWAWYTS